MAVTGHGFSVKKLDNSTYNMIFLYEIALIHMQ